MMKRFLMILVAGLLWGNVGFAATYKLERCHIYNTEPKVAKLPDQWKVVVLNKFDSSMYEKFEFEINSDSKTVKSYWSSPNRYLLGFGHDPSYSGQGVKILDMNSNYPVKKARLKRKDILIAFDGTPMNSIDDLRKFMANYAVNNPGSPIEITFKRKKKTKTVMVTPKFTPKRSDLNVYNITFYDSRSVEAKHQSHPDFDQVKINIEDGTIVNGIVISQTKSVQYYLQCSKDSKPEKSIELITLIQEAKNTCKDLGFEEGTEKFAECGLKLYTQSVELAAKNNQPIVIQGQSSGSNVMTIYDPVRDSNAAIKRGQGLLNGTCTITDLSTC